MDPFTGTGTGIAQSAGPAVGAATAVTAANRLTAEWAARIADGASTVFSGAGVWPLLGLIALGADGPGRSELAAAYGLDPASTSTAVRGFIDLFDRAPALRAAIGLWYQERLPMLDSWLDQLPPSTRGRLSGDLAADKARLDAWAREHTDGLLNEMPVALTPLTVLVLASAIMVQTTWLQEFNESSCAAQGGPWAGAGPFASLVRMIQPETLRVLAGGPGIGQITSVSVAGDNDIDVVLFLGEQGVSAGQVLNAGLAGLAGLSADYLSAHDHTAAGAAAAATKPSGRFGWRGGKSADVISGPGITVQTFQSTMRDSLYMLTVPKFTVKAQHDLLADAKLFGLDTVSKPGFQHFPGIAAAELHVSSAKQDAMAEFSATGFRAAAVSAFAMSVGSAAPPQTHKALRYDIVLDRPFGFAAVHRPTGLVVVAGWVAEVEFFGSNPYGTPAYG